MPAYIQDVVRGLARAERACLCAPAGFSRIYRSYRSNAISFRRPPSVMTDPALQPLWAPAVAPGPHVPGSGPVTQGLNDQSSSNAPGERAGAACAILGSFKSGPYHVAWRFSFPFIQLDRKGL